jgi:hypothetical protein
MKLFKWFAALFRLSPLGRSATENYKIIPLPNGQIQLERYESSNEEEVAFENIRKTRSSSSDNTVQTCTTFVSVSSLDRPPKLKSAMRRLSNESKNNIYMNRRVKFLSEFDEDEEYEEDSNEIPQTIEDFARTVKKIARPTVMISEDFVTKRKSMNLARREFQLHMNDLKATFGEDLISFSCWQHDASSLENFLEALYPISQINGPIPAVLPFTVKSFIEYLFLDCRDIHLIREMLKACRRSPDLLRFYEKNVFCEEKRSGLQCKNCLGIRDSLLLPFLVKMQQIDGRYKSSMLHLMGFSSIRSLKSFYAVNEMMYQNIPEIGELVSQLDDDHVRRFGDFGSSSDGESEDEEDAVLQYEYVNEAWI